MTLHIISNPDRLEQCLKIALVHDALLFTEECQENSNTTLEQLKTALQSVYWLSEKVDGAPPACGISIDYKKFVELCEQHNPIQSWY